VRTFRHEVLCYEGPDGFVRDVAPIVADGLSARAAILVVAPSPHLHALARELDGQADDVELVDADGVGRNPGRLIDVWNELLGRELESGRPVLGIGESLWAARSADEVDECITHEHLVNAAFSGHMRFRLVCPVDTEGLDPSVADRVLAAHPHIHDRDDGRPSETFRRPSVTDILERPLPPTPGGAEHLTVEPGSLPALRRRVRDIATAAGLEPVARVDDLVLAASEIGANSVLHGGGTGRIAIWRDERSVWCEVADGGHIDDPLIGRRRARDDDQGGRGIWIAHQVCDLVQVRSGRLGTTVRLRMDLAAGR
jgi:anti-sigma regulatory factor (Ser/Thr protein kinase)